MNLHDKWSQMIRIHHPRILALVSSTSQPCLDLTHLGSIDLHGAAAGCDENREGSVVSLCQDDLPGQKEYLCHVSSFFYLIVLFLLIHIFQGSIDQQMSIDVNGCQLSIAHGFIFASSFSPLLLLVQRPHRRRLASPRCLSNNQGIRHQRPAKEIESSADFTKNH